MLTCWPSAMVVMVVLLLCCCVVNMVGMVVCYALVMWEILLSELGEKW